MGWWGQKKRPGNTKPCLEKAPKLITPTWIPWDGPALLNLPKKGIVRFSPALCKAPAWGAALTHPKLPQTNPWSSWVGIPPGWMNLNKFISFFFNQI